MMNKRAFLALSIVSLVCTVVMVVLMARPRRRQSMIEPPDPFPTVSATTQPPAQASPIVDAAPDVSNVRVGGITVLYPRVPLLEMKYNPRRYEFVPGAVIPGLDGRRVEDATHIVITTYPGVTVRAVDRSEPLNLEVRRDRITLEIDPYTRRVVTARVG